LKTETSMKKPLEGGADLDKSIYASAAPRESVVRLPMAPTQRMSTT
jgi:hypothetical protein